MNWTKRPWYIHSLGSMIAPRGISTISPNGNVVRAVPEPYYSYLPERIRAAWWIIRGKAYAVTWPKAGDLEEILNR